MLPRCAIFGLTLIPVSVIVILMFATGGGAVVCRLIGALRRGHERHRGHRCEREEA